LPFFSAQKLGTAAEYGPLGVDAVLDFCDKLSETLNKTSTLSNVGLYCSQRGGAVLNSLLLIGSFLILERNMCTADVVQLIRPQSQPDIMEQKFPRPWCSKNAWSQDALSLRECLQGFEVAVANNWLHRKSLNGSSRRKVAMAYDAMPIFTVKLVRDSIEGGPYKDHVTFWIAADPITTVVDTSYELDDVLTVPSSSSASTHGSTSCQTPKKGSNTPQRGSKRDAGMTSRIRRVISNGSLFKPTAQSTDPKEDVTQANSVDRPQALKDFANWLKNDLGCVMVVRANFDDEPNLPPEGSYGNFFHHQGIQQVDIPFPDGTAPPQSVVQTLLVEVSLLLDRLKGKSIRKPCNYAVLVHCKSGFGRSMSLLCMLAVALFPDIEATDIFGWARLARPGAIQTTAQERFVRSLDEEERPAVSCCWKGNIKTGPSIRDLLQPSVQDFLQCKQLHDKVFRSTC